MNLGNKVVHPSLMISCQLHQDTTKCYFRLSDFSHGKFKNLVREKLENFRFKNSHELWKRYMYGVH